MNPIHSCNEIYNRAKISKISNIILKSSSAIDITPKDLLSTIRKDYGQEVKYITAQKALTNFKVKSKVILNPSYDFLQGLMSTFNVELTQATIEFDNDRFKRYFITCAGTKNFFSFNKKIISVDGTFLSGPNKGTLLMAVAQDEKDQLVLLAFAIVESENLDFFSFL